MKIQPEFKVPITKLHNVQFSEDLVYYSDELSPPIELRGAISHSILYAYEVRNYSQPFLAIYLESARAENVEVGWSKDFLFLVITRAEVSYQFGASSKSLRKKWLNAVFQATQVFTDLPTKRTGSDFSLKGSIESLLSIKDPDVELEQYKKQYQEEKHNREVLEKKYAYQLNQLRVLEHDKAEITTEVKEYHKEVGKLRDQITVQDAMIKTYVLNIQELEKAIISLNKKLKVLQDVTLSVNTNRRYIPNITIPLNKRASKNFDRLQFDSSNNNEKNSSTNIPKRSPAPFVRHRRNNSQTTVSDKLNILQNEDKYIKSTHPSLTHVLISPKMDDSEKFNFTGSVDVEDIVDGSNSNVMRSGSAQPIRSSDLCDNDVIDLRPRSLSDETTDRSPQIDEITSDCRINQNIIYLLFAFDSHLIRHIYTVLSTQDKTKFIHILIKISISRDLFYPLINYCLNDSIAVLKDYRTFLRSDSMFHKVWSSYSRTVGKEYLNSVVAPILIDICCDTNSDISRIVDGLRTDTKSIDPSIFSKEAIVFVNHLVSIIIKKIMVRRNQIPRGLLYIISLTVKQLSITYQLEDKDLLLLGSSFFFLNFLCPVLIAPYPSLLTNKPDSFQQKVLVHIVKIIQKLSFLTHFTEADGNYIVSNSTIDQLTSEMSSFLYYIITVPYATSVDSYTVNTYNEDQSPLTTDLYFLKNVIINYFPKYSHSLDSSYLSTLKQMLPFK